MIMKKLVALTLVLAIAITINFASCGGEKRTDFTTVESYRDDFGYWKDVESLPIDQASLMDQTAHFLFACGHDLSKETQLSLAGVYINRLLSSDWEEGNLKLDYLEDEGAKEIVEGIDLYAFWHEGADLPEEAKPFEDLISIACSNADIAVYEGLEPYHLANFRPVFYVSLDRQTGADWQKIGELWFASNPD